VRELVYRKVVPQALLNENRVVLQGSPDERLPGGQVYVSPTSRRVYDGEKGDRLANLPPDATEIPKTTWWLKLPQLWKGRGADKAPQIPFPVAGRATEMAAEMENQEARSWYGTPAEIQRLKAEYQEMKRYFPDFDLYQDDLSMLVWIGSIEGLGETRIQYPADYPRSPFKLKVIGATDSQNAEVNEKISEYRALNITPAGALIVAMRMSLAKEKEPNAVVSDTPRPEETPSRDQADA